MTEHDPICAGCRPPRIEDLDPQTTVFYCTRHQKIMDQVLAGLEGIIAPLSARENDPPRWTGIPDIGSWQSTAAAPLAPKRNLQDLIHMTAATEQSPIASGYALDMAIEFMKKWENRAVPTTPAAIVVDELHRAIVPIGAEHLAVRIVDALREHLLPDPERTRTEYEVHWHAGGDGIVLDQAHLISEAEAHKIGATRIGQYGITRYTIHRREHRNYPDGSTWTSPWQTVTDTTPTAQADQQP